MIPFARLTIVGLLLLRITVASGMRLSADDPPQAEHVSSNADAKLAAARIQFPEQSGLKAELYACEPLLANPVAFAFDHQGRVFVAEAHRIHEGVTDNRDHMDWLDDDLACRTVADRDVKYRKHLKENYASFTRQSDQVRLLFSSRGNGPPDRASVFARSQHRAIDGLGSGVLAYGDSVFYTCIPDLLLLKDTTGSGVANQRRILSSGYGVHTSFFGHDLHGLVISPVDGKLYFSIGDRGAHVQSYRAGKTAGVIDVPHTGAVFRCNLDGSDLELFAKGLRNPQELAFDDEGNLFTCDNNSDSGDRARVVYLPEGADCGWHIGYQYLEHPFPRGPWNAEQMWHPPISVSSKEGSERRPAFIVPPIANLGDGPSGLTFYPGTGLPQRYRGHFFLADFRGSAVSSGIRSFAVKPKGAGFELIDSHPFAWGVLATDVEFGPDGALYILDWVDGWTKTGKGRIHRVSDQKQQATEQAGEIATLLRSDWPSKSTAELGRLLGHADRRIRMQAQFTLAGSPQRSAAALEFARNLRQRNNRFARLHALWGMGQLLSSGVDPLVASALKEALSDEDAGIVINSLRVTGRPDFRLEAGCYRRLLTHTDPHVQAAAAVCMAKQKAADALPELLHLIRGPGFNDPWLRHSCVMALRSLLSETDPANCQELGRDSAAIRLALVLAWRESRAASDRLLPYVKDRDPAVQNEAIRALHEIEPLPFEIANSLPPIVAAMPPMIQFRLLHLHFRGGGAESAQVLGRYALDSGFPTNLRIKALEMLATWEHPPGRDWVTGLWRPLAARSAEPAQIALRGIIDRALAMGGRPASEAARAAAHLRLIDLGPRMATIAADQAIESDLRLSALQAAESLNAANLEPALQSAARAQNAALRAAALAMLVRISPVQAVESLSELLERGSIQDKQKVFSYLAEIQQAEAKDLVEKWLRLFAAGQAPPEIQLDIVEAARNHPRETWAGLINQGQSALARTGPYGEFRLALHGGDVQAGRKVFFEKTSAACLRCHKVRREGGEVGPELTHIGKEKSREYLLESLVDPNKTIAKGFELTTLVTKEGIVHQGVVKAEDEKQLRLITPEAKTVEIQKSDLEERKTGKSAMPEDTIKHLSLREVRDLVEYLSSLK